MTAAHFFKIFFMWTIFKVFIESVTIWFTFCFSVLEACGILVPQPGIETILPALEGSLNHRTTREVPGVRLKREEDGASLVKDLPAKAGDSDSTPWSGKIPHATE